MKPMSKAGFREGAIGALILAVLLYVLTFFGAIKEPIFVENFKDFFGVLGFFAHPASLLIHMILGGFWGFVFTLIPVKKSYLTGAAYGIVPTLWIWLIAYPSMFLPLFGGGDMNLLIQPLVLNIPIWGGFVGYRLSKVVDLEKTA